MYRNWLIIAVVGALGIGLGVLSYAVFTPFIGIPLLIVVAALLVVMIRRPRSESAERADPLETEKLNRPDRPDAGEARPSH